MSNRLELQMCAGSIPPGSKVRKVSGSKEYTLVNSLKVYDNTVRPSDSHTIRPERNCIFLLDGSANISQDSKSKTLVWIADQNAVIRYIHELQGLAGIPSTDYPDLV